MEQTKEVKKWTCIIFGAFSDRIETDYCEKTLVILNDMGLLNAAEIEVHIPVYIFFPLYNCFMIKNCIFSSSV